MIHVATSRQMLFDDEVAGDLFHVDQGDLLDGGRRFASPPTG